MFKMSSNQVQRKVRFRKEEYDICPHCEQEIQEKSIYFDGKNWFHRPCLDKGPIQLYNGSSESFDAE